MAEGSGTAEPPTAPPPVFKSPSDGNPSAPDTLEPLDAPAANGSLGASEPATAKAPEVPSEFPFASEAAIVTSDGLLPVEPITSAPWMIWLAVSWLPSVTVVVPVPSTVPTC